MINVLIDSNLFVNPIVMIIDSHGNALSCISFTTFTEISIIFYQEYVPFSTDLTMTSREITFEAIFETILKILTQFQRNYLIFITFNINWLKNVEKDFHIIYGFVDCFQM